MATIKELKPSDEAINEDIIQWLVDNKDEISQISVIVVWKPNKENNISSMRSSMNNMEKIWWWEQLKKRLLE